MKNLFLVLFILQLPLLAGDKKTEEKLVEIVTSDGIEYIGVITAEDDNSLSLRMPSGIVVQVPITAIESRKDFSGKVEAGKVWRPDPNKSMYLFAPSAFPIDAQHSYCRDFCLFFPSYNHGFGNVLSLQLGAFWFPGAKVDETPLVASLKYTVLQAGKIGLAGGGMYIKLPAISESENLAFGFVFVTGTVGDRFNHASASLGLGYVQIDDEFEFMERPILVLAGNQRMSNSLAFVGETWITPESDADMIPIILAMRFFGKKISVDLGGLISLNQKGWPFPIINFTYHF
ncbi:MAG: hypothetical protein ABIA75_12510 [Candidatus Neomarinimicrobiota bacterium]